MTHKLRGDVVYLDPSGRDDSNRRRAMRAIVVSSFGLLLTSAFEISMTVLSGSVALLSDALHNLGDVFTTVGVYFGFRASRKQPTRRYPYGYGRAEDLTGIVIVIAIWSSAALAGWQSYDKLVSGRGTTHLTLGMVAAVVGILGNQVVARYKLSVGRAIKSTPLIVDARHSMLDAVASAGALAGLIGVAFGLRVADPIAGLAITVLIVHIGIDATRDVASRLMDANDEQLTEAVRAAAMGVPSVREVGDVRVRWLGRQAEVRMIVRLPATLPLTQAHDIAHGVQERVLNEVPDIREVMVEPAPLPTERFGSPPAHAADLQTPRVPAGPALIRNVTHATLHSVTSDTRSGTDWILMTYRVPPEPSRHRVAVWRELRKVGAIPVQQATWVLPNRREFADAVARAVGLVDRGGGEALVLDVTGTDEATTGRLEQMFTEAREAEWTEFLSECAKFEAEIEKEIRTAKFTAAELDEEEQNFDQLRRWFRELRARDLFVAPSQEQAERRLKACIEVLEAFAERVYQQGEQT